MNKLTELLTNREGDSHLHTNWTDGENTIDEMIKSANTCGLKWINFSEHNRKNSKYSYKEFCDEITEKSNKYKVRFHFFPAMSIISIKFTFQKISSSVYSKYHR